ncbi:chaperone Hsp40, co-chaperone with DnaK [Oceanicaulis sp. 350]|jgi:molecular chaperone DnaJ|uniref:molecular chaperone DnaJ n=1 Tax=Oceanicaulis alexandrii TaxID=153233 RepID=UPI0012EF92D2|nr:molecular chaperone DnaJ [Oceanicaulis alexandrii]MBL4538489.1 molecular chaperone DnaJ [Oceanicaulis sp.]VXC90155.1 chaperone Hsp40, co-chaperone with DnaK [Oceanicaulis sp. 350]
MSKRDYYEVLGVAKDADAKAIKSAYRKLAMKYHPDQNPDDAEAEAKFKEVGEAYAILSDADKRAAYDRMGHAAFQQGGAGGGHPFGGGAGSADFADIFEQVFGDAFGMGGGRRGGGGRRSGPARGSDLRYDMQISLEEAYHGKDANIRVPTTVTCERCEGDGAEPGTGVTTCETCGGAGRIRRTQGFFTMEQSCPTCGGRGSYVETPCQECDGAGRVRKTRDLRVQIPAGVEDGMRIRLAGEGEAGARGGPKGDLYIFVSVGAHDLFERDGPNLYCRAPVSMVTAALGGEIDAPTIDGGKVKIRIPEGAQTGERMRLRNKGMVKLNGGGARGDMYVELFVETPRKMTERQKEILREFCEISGDGCNPESDGFFNKVRRFWDDLNGEDEHGQRPEA